MLPKPVGTDPKNDDDKTQLAETHITLAVVYGASGRLHESEAANEKAIGILQPLPAPRPELPEYGLSLAGAPGNAGRGRKGARKAERRPEAARPARRAGRGGAPTGAVYALSIGPARKDDRVVPAERSTHAERDGAEAGALLPKLAGQAISMTRNTPGRWRPMRTCSQCPAAPISGIC